MKILPGIHNRNHIIKSYLGRLELLLGNPHRPGELTVINYHGTQRKFLAELESQLNYFKENFEVLDPSSLDMFYQSKLNDTKRPLLLITFDDGIRNNLLAADVLKAMDLRAMFFVVPEFINTPEDQQKDYFVRCIRPMINPAIDSEEEDFSAMSWKELKGLMQQGHQIGSHTLTHTLVAASSGMENSRKEIIDSRALIAEHLDVSVSSIRTFCSINNTLESIGSKELDLIQKNYDYHFTTIPGPNHPGTGPFFIKRCNIESHWLPGAVRYALGRWDLRRWKSAEETYLGLLKGVKA